MKIKIVSTVQCDENELLKFDKHLFLNSVSVSREKEYSNGKHKNKNLVSNKWRDKSHSEGD